MESILSTLADRNEAPQITIEAESLQLLAWLSGRESAQEAEHIATRILAGELTVS